MPEKTKTTRVQVEMPETSMKRLKYLQERTEVASYAQVLRNALQLYEAVLDEQEDGSTMYLKRRDGKEVELRILM